MERSILQKRESIWVWLFSPAAIITAIIAGAVGENNIPKSPAFLIAAGITLIFLIGLLLNTNKIEEFDKNEKPNDEL